jgi:hypothetical protein
MIASFPFAVNVYQLYPNPDAEAEVMIAIGSKAAKQDAADAFMLDDDDLIDDGAEARRHLAAGRPVYYAEADTPEGLVVRESPDGSKDLIRVDPDRVVRVIGPPEAKHDEPGAATLGDRGSQRRGEVIAGRSAIGEIDGYRESGRHRARSKGRRPLSGRCTGRIGPVDG